MPENTEKTTATTRIESTARTAQTVVERAADLSDDVLKSVEAGQRAAIEAVRKSLTPSMRRFPQRTTAHHGKKL